MVRVRVGVRVSAKVVRGRIGQRLSITINSAPLCTVHWNVGYEGQFHIFHYILFVYSCIYIENIDITFISDIVVPDICGK